MVILVIAVGAILMNKPKYTSPDLTAFDTVTPAQTANSVAIENFAFSPATITVKAGTTVTWTNRDSAAHTVKSDSFTSPSLNQGETYSYTFNDTGSFAYTCGVHPAMKGTVVVE